MSLELVRVPVDGLPPKEVREAIYDALHETYLAVVPGEYGEGFVEALVTG